MKCCNCQNSHGRAATAPEGCDRGGRSQLHQIVPGYGKPGFRFDDANTYCVLLKLQGTTLKELKRQVSCNIHDSW